MNTKVRFFASLLRRAAPAVLALAASAGILHSDTAQAASANLSVIPIHESYAGLTYQEWAVRWWLWEFNPGLTKNSPFCDPTGEKFSVGQSGPVWFLPGWGCDGPVPHVRRVTLPAGKALLLTCPSAGSQTRLTKEQLMALTTDVGIEIDGQPVEDLNSYYVESEPFVGVYPEDNIYNIPPGPVTFYATGVFVLLQPLSVGEHTIVFRWTVLEGMFAGSYHETFHVTVPPAPRITQQPVAQSVSLGANVTFAVTATGTAPLTYQWLLNEQLLPGVTNRTLTLTNVTLANAGHYFVAVTDATGSSTNSRLALLEVDPTFTKITTGAIVTDRADHEGLTWADYDNDGWIDLYSGTGFGGPNSFLYRNTGGGTFTRMTSATVGSIVQTGGEDCAWGDYDNDGFLDLFVVTASQPSVLHRNNGNGTFTRITTGPMLPANGNDHRGCAWGDFDNDGHLDLFVSSGPRGGGRNTLYRNRGDGTFTTLTNRPFNLSALSINCAWGDYNNDGRLDLFASAGAGSANFLYRNDGQGAFASMTAATAGSFVADASNTGTWGDYDNDGYLDLFLAGGPFGTPSYLHRNTGTGTFSRVTGTRIGPLAANAVAGAWGDYDNDGHLDLFVANFDSTRNGLYHNNGDGTFTRVTSGSPINDAAIFRLAYSCAWSDYDNDGFLDLAVANISSGDPPPNFLYRNNGNSNGWLKVKCVGTASNRAGIGVKVRLQATIAGKTFWQLREISGGGGYGGQNLIAHFGLGNALSVEALRVEWPSGMVQELNNVPKNQQLTVTELPRLVATGPGQLRVLSWKNQQFGLEASANLLDWASLGTVTNETGTLEFKDPASPHLSPRFYRALVK